MAVRVAIIGGGLAGASCAYVLGQAGYDPVIFEAADTLANGASGNPVGLYNPRFFAEKTPEADFYAESFQKVAALFKNVGTEIEHSPHGSLHLINSDDKHRRFSKMQKNWNWPEDKMKLLAAEEASDIAGVPLKHTALFLPTSGTISPPKLCHYYTKDIDVRLNTPVQDFYYNEGWSVNGEKFEIAILACGAGIKQFPETEHLPVYTVRGQIAAFSAGKVSSALKTNLNFGGYITPSDQGIHICGSTFQKWLSDTDLREEDNEYIKNNLIQTVPSFSDLGEVKFARAALRTSSKDRLPIIGKVPNQGIEKGISFQHNLYVSTAHGSHGIVSSYGAACLILEEIQNKKRLHYASHFAPERFLKRLLRKSG